MARTTVDEVKEIMDNTALDDAQITPYITVANTIVTDELGSSSELTDDKLEEIERWLTAHLIAITRERITKQEKLGDASVTYTGAFGSGLDSTPYGQMVRILDVSGILGNLGKRVISIKAITSFE